MEDGAAPVVEDAADLLWIVNQDSVEIHPWLSQKENLNYADLLVFDLDPGSRLPFQRLCEAATVVPSLALLAWDCNWTKTLSPNISCSYPQFRVASRSIKAAKFGKFSKSSTMLAISPACCEPSTGSALSMNF